MAPPQEDPTSGTVVNNDSTEDKVPDDAELLKGAEEKAGIECYLEAAVLLKQVSDPSLLTDNHKHVLSVADRAENVKKDLFKKFEEGGWQNRPKSTATETLAFITKSMPMHPLLSALRLRSNPVC